MFDEITHRLVIGVIWIDPARVDLGLLQGFRHICLDSISEVSILVIVQCRKRPGSDQRLIQQVLLVAIRSESSVHLGFVPFVELTPSLDASFPDLRNF